MSDKQWFYAIYGKQNGPVTETQIKNMFDEGQVYEGTLFWTEEMLECLSVSEMSEIVTFETYRKKSPPSLPETSNISQIRPVVRFGKLIFYFIFAWLVSIMTGFSTITIAACFFDLNPANGFSFGAAVIVLALAVLRYGVGAFVLGTLTRQCIRTWAAAIIYVIPSFLLQGLTFAAAIINEATKEELLANPGFLIIMPVIYLLVSPAVSFYFLRLGEDSSDEFSRPNSVLNVPWQHWLWVLPFFLFQAIGVPLFLLLVLWKIDIFMYNAPLHALIPRIIVGVILVGVLAAIKAAYEALIDDLESTGIRILKVLGTWLLLTIMQIFIVLYVIGKHMD